MRTPRWVAFVVVVGGMFGVAGSLAAQEKGLVFAHRGGAHEFEENTLAAFRGSYENGLRGFETDIRMTQDGELVILHDDTLNRTHNATGAVEQKTAAELRKVVTTKSGQPMLFLKDLLAYSADKPGIYLELEMKAGNKAQYPDDRLNEYCRKLYDAACQKPQGSFYVLTSFDERPLKVVKSLDGYWWFGCYGMPQVMLKTDDSFRLLGKYDLDCSLGIVGLSEGQFLVARGRSQVGEGCSGRVMLAHAEPDKGLVVKDEIK